MAFEKLIRVVIQNIKRSKKNFIFSSIGIIVGISTFTFFLALSQGISDRVLNRIFPIDQLEVEPIGGVAAGATDQGATGNTLTDVLAGGPRRLDAAAIEQLASVPGVAAAFPKMRGRFPAKIETGVLDRRMAGEGFFEGIEISETVVNEMRLFEESCAVEEEDTCKRREVSCASNADCPHEGMECREGACRARQYWRSFHERDPNAFGPGEGTCAAASECGTGNVCAVDQWVIVKSLDKPDAKLKEAAAALEHATLDLDFFIAIAEQGRLTRTDVDLAERSGAELWNVGAEVLPEVAAAAKAQGVVIRDFKDMPAAFAHVAAVPATLTAGVCKGAPCSLEQKEEDIGHWLYFDYYDNHRGSCELGRYCAARNVQSAEGRCEHYLPAALNPLMIDFYNSNVVSQLGTQPLPSPCLVLGLKGYFRFGFSFLSDDMDPVWQRVRWAEIVGFTDKGMHLGGTMPLGVVEGLNRFYLGKSSTEYFDSVLLQIPRNEDVAGVIEGIQKLSFDLSRTSSFARKAGEMLMIVTLTFLLISIIIVVISAMNISHTFLMVVFERQKELGVMRAIGATRWDIRLVILFESLFIGLVAGIVGNGLSYGISRLVNLGAAGLRGRFPMIPDDFFIYSWPLVLGSMLFAIAFCLVGAWVPANRAARLDPAVVLTQA